jgi:hypothetical protein
MSESGHSLQIVWRRKLLHVCNAPKADAESEPWQPVTKGHGGNRREPPSSDNMVFAGSRIGGTTPKKALRFYAKKLSHFFAKYLIYRARSSPPLGTMRHIQPGVDRLNEPCASSSARRLAACHEGAWR